MKNEPVKKLKKIAYPIAIATAAAITAASLSSCSLFDKEPSVMIDGDVPYQTQIVDGSGEEELGIPGEPAEPDSQIDLAGNDREVVEVGVPAVPDSQIDLEGCDDDDCDTDADTDILCTDDLCVTEAE